MSLICTLLFFIFLFYFPFLFGIYFLSFIEWKYFVALISLHNTIVENLRTNQIALNIKILMA